MVGWNPGYLLLAHCLQQWPNIKTTLHQRLILARSLLVVKCTFLSCSNLALASAGMMRVMSSNQTITPVETHNADMSI